MFENFNYKEAPTEEQYSELVRQLGDTHDKIAIEYELGKLGKDRPIEKEGAFEAMYAVFEVNKAIAVTDGMHKILTLMSEAAGDKDNAPPPFDAKGLFENIRNHILRAYCLGRLGAAVDAEEQLRKQGFRGEYKIKL